MLMEGILYVNNQSYFFVQLVQENNDLRRKVHERLEKGKNALY